MKAIVVHEYGGPEVLKFEDVPRPEPKDDEILVRTQLKNVRGSLIHFGYEVVRESDSALLAEGETTHIVTDAEMKKRELPEKYQSIFRSAVGKAVR